MIDAGHGGRHSAGRNILLRFAAIYGASAILGMGTYYGYRFYCESNNNGFLKGTTVDGEDVSGMSVKAARELILDKYADSEIVITENENEDLKFALCLTAIILNFLGSLSEFNENYGPLT